MENWQTIESVPKEQDVLLYVPDFGIVIAMDCSEKGKKQFLDSAGYDVGTPTHWMYLPEEPIIK